MERWARLNTLVFPVTSSTLTSDGAVKKQRFLQSAFWASFKESHGWQASRFYCTTESEAKTQVTFSVSVLCRSFSGLGSIAYIPLGPDSLDDDFWAIYNTTKKYLELLNEFTKQITVFLPKNTLCVRFDPPIEWTDLQQKNEILQACAECGIKKTPTDIQPPDTVILDLSPPVEQLLEQMKSKWRYNIRLSEKKGVTVCKGTVDDIDVFYSLYQETAKRDGIAIHSKAYYQDLLRRGNEVSLYLAQYEGQYLAAIITLFNDYEAVYLYGASSNEKRNLMPAYLLQWTAICDAKAKGCSYYDFYGIPPNDDETHPMHGLYRFKTGFGGNIVHRIGSLDIPVSPLYSVYVLLEKLRSFWFKRVKKIFVRRTN